MKASVEMQCDFKYLSSFINSIEYRKWKKKELSDDHWINRLESSNVYTISIPLIQYIFKRCVFHHIRVLLVFFSSSPWIGLSRFPISCVVAAMMQYIYWHEKIEWPKCIFYELWIWGKIVWRHRIYEPKALLIGVETIWAINFLNVIDHHVNDSSMIPNGRQIDIRYKVETVSKLFAYFWAEKKTR